MSFMRGFFFSVKKQFYANINSFFVLKAFCTFSTKALHKQVLSAPLQPITTVALECKSIQQITQHILKITTTIIQ